MADTTYKVNVDTRGAISALDGLKAAVGGLALAFAGREFTQIAQTFENLRVTLQILYKDVQRGNAVFADIKRFAQTSSFSVDDLTETVIKLKSAGLNPTIAQLKFFSEVSAVAADKVGALRAITDLYARTTAGGLGLEDLNRLADRGIPVFTILKDVLGINRLEITKLGQSAKGAQIILAALEQGLSQAFGGGSELRAKTLSQATSNLRDAFNNMIDTMGQEGGLNSSLAKLANALAEAIQNLTPLAVAFARALTPAIKFVTENAEVFLRILIALSALIATALIVRVVALAGAFLKLGQILNLIAKNPVVFAVFFALSYALNKVSEDSHKVKKELEDLDEQMKQMGGLEQGGAIGGTEDLRRQIGQLNPEIDKLNAKYKIQNDELKTYTGQLFDRLGFQARMIGKTEEEVELQTELRNELERFTNQVKEARDRQSELRAAVLNETDTMKVAAMGHELDLISKFIENATKAHQQNNHQITYGINLIQSQRAAEENRKRNLELITQELQRQQDIQFKLRDAVRQARDAVEEEQYKRSRLPGLAGQITDIQRANRIAAEAAGRGFAELFNIEDMTSEDAERLRSGLNRIAEAYGEISQIQIEQLEYSRTWASGWDEAFQQFKDNAYNAADQAKSYFSTFVSGFESAIVRFVQTGKLSFKDLVTNMLAEFAKIEAKRMLFNFLGASGLGSYFRNIGFGTGMGFGSMDFGGFFANGGTLGAGKWGIAGERGPELITGPANITPIQNQQPVTVNYNISAVDAASFRALVARDPQFIYNITEQGRRSQPTRRL